MVHLVCCHACALGKSVGRLQCGGAFKFDQNICIATVHIMNTYNLLLYICCITNDQRGRGWGGERERMGQIEKERVRARERERERERKRRSPGINHRYDRR